MSTRSRVGIEEADGKIRSVYVHNDGDVDALGSMLRTHWTNRHEVDALLSLGEISGVGISIDLDDGTFAYARDRYEDLIAPYESVNRTAYVELMRESGGEFAYLFTTDEQWLVYQKHADAPEWHALET